MNRLKKANEIFQVLTTSGGAAAIFKSRPRSLTSFRIVRNLASEKVDFRTIIDGGANIGQFARAASQAFPLAKIFSFEPLPDIAETLQRNLSDVKHHETIVSALGNTDGGIEFHRNSYDQTSSILALGGHKLPMMEGVTEIETISVPISRLDTLFGETELPGPVLLKLDLQGYELEALKGAKQFLQRCDYILLEAAFEEMYEGEPLFDDLLKYLSNHGFQFRRPMHFAEDNNGRILQIDALFKKTT